MVMPNRQSILQEVLSWPTAERSKFAVEVLDSLNDGQDADADEAWAEEIARRIKEIESGEAKLIPYDEAMKMIMQDDLDGDC